jgi:hypothetical protein
MPRVSALAASLKVVCSDCVDMILMGSVGFGTRPDAADMAFAAFFGTAVSWAPRITIAAIPGAEGRLVTPHYCSEALSTDNRWRVMSRLNAVRRSATTHGSLHFF